MFQLRRESGVVQQNARLDVSILAALGEVGTGYERPFPIDRNTFCMQAAPWWAPTQGSSVTEELRVRGTEGPVVVDEGAEHLLPIGLRIDQGLLDLREVDEEMGANAVWCQNAAEVSRISEAESVRTNVPG